MIADADADASTSAQTDIRVAPDLVWPYLVEQRESVGATAVTVFDQPRAYAWIAQEPASIWLFTLEPVVAGTRLRGQVTPVPGAGTGSPGLAGRELLGELRGGLLMTLEAARRRAESRA
jgi:hypothetical protein